ncbi:MAG: hypothetical protein LAN70_18695 [Acidobacteriia bacterium]|nr:hypothetical protein [Terriglobia bacterium]
MNAQAAIPVDVDALTETDDSSSPEILRDDVYRDVVEIDGGNLELLKTTTDEFVRSGSGK